ncbi:plasmolipin [Mugil cephalus]|uniref:plasmolipin n=1 Tax=Mugil cephalus TaxID=48193 RepID=UPI001FB7C771|nr:plasmolipin [Mugil cephalus]
MQQRFTSYLCFYNYRGDLQGFFSHFIFFFLFLFLRSKTCGRSPRREYLFCDRPPVFKDFVAVVDTHHPGPDSGIMADFPSKVSTETSSPHSHSSQHQGVSARISVDMMFIRSVSAILMLVEIVLGLLHWALIAATIPLVPKAYGWVMFVAVTLWVLTTILFFIILFGVQRLLPPLPWPLIVMVYNGIATVLYFTAFVTNAATVESFFQIVYNHLAAAAFFGSLVTVAYGVSAFFSFKDWREGGGSVATSTVPT